MKKILGLIALSLVLTQSAYADFETANAALQKQDFAIAYPLMKEAAEAGDHQAWLAVGKMLLVGTGTEKNPTAALPWLEKAANAGDADAMNMLAQLYFSGDQVPKNTDAATSWAHRSAATGDMVGQYLVAQVDLYDPSLSFLDASGKPSMEKYDALAKRPATERALDQEEFTMLSKSAEQGYGPAKNMAIAALMDKVGPTNRARLLELAAATTNIPDPLRHRVAIVTVLQKLGESHASFTLFMDTEQTAAQSAELRAKSDGITESEQCKIAQMKLAKTEISRPLENAIYLPTEAKLLDNFYLISGQWQETWTYNVCGKMVAVPIEFQADGLGGAYFQTKLN
ncbi:tetratricopeptide repeat protein [Glaciimonas soli]|nr:tetratricopeptide repeat protein [Glaciimonas soli]